MRRPPIFVLIATLAACSAAPEGSSATPDNGRQTAAAVPGQPQGDAIESQNPPPTVEGCGADRLGRYFNVLPTDPIKAEIAEAVDHDRIRYIAPGDMVTEDFRPDRLNVETGDDGRIKLFRCG